MKIILQYVKYIYIIHITHTMKNGILGLFYICNDPERALGLETYLPNFHIICIDYKEIVDFIEEKGINIFCLEKELKQKNPIFRNSNRLLQQNLVQQYILQHTKEEQTSNNVIFFKIARDIEFTCKRLGYNILNTTSQLNKQFENKLSQYELLESAGVNFPKTTFVKLEDTSYDRLTKYFKAENLLSSDLISTSDTTSNRFGKSSSKSGGKSSNKAYSETYKSGGKSGEKFVIQYNRGHTGTGTVYIENQNQFQAEQQKFPKRKARISRFIDGETYTLNACVTKYGILFGGLSYQITGISEFTSQVGGTVGNDWSYPQKLSSKTVEEIASITQNAGKVMQEAGYKGLFGVDLVVDKQGIPYLIEINARQPASTSIHTKLLLKDRLMPLELIHIYEFLEENYDLQDMDGNKLTLEEYNKQAMKPIKATQIIIRNTADSKLTVLSDVASGVYNVKSGNFVRKGWSVDSISANKSEIELLFQCMPKGHNVTRGSEIARIQFLDNGVDYKTGELKKEYFNFLLNKSPTIGKLK